jgi:hypothetical protein
MPAGYTIRVTAPATGGASIEEYFDVAIDNEDQALVPRMLVQLLNSHGLSVRIARREITDLCL